MIRLSFGIKYENNVSSGKHKFANRLVNCIKRDHADKIMLVDRNVPCDIHITFDGKCKIGCKNIYRIDGVWMNTLEGDLKAKNTPIVNGIIEAQGVIYQSEFCGEAVAKFLNIAPRKSTIIYNGAEPNEFSLNPKYRPKKPAFIAICKWRPHKRLNDIVHGFLRSKASSETELHIFGEAKQEIKNPNLIYHGWSQASHKILPWCVASVHVSYLDWCPNAVVESLVAGVPVIYAKSGGTPYVVKDSGFSVSDYSWDFTPINLYKKHQLNYDELGAAYDKAYDQYVKNDKKTNQINRTDLFIENVAKKYVSFIQEINGK